MMKIITVISTTLPPITPPTTAPTLPLPSLSLSSIPNSVIGSHYGKGRYMNTHDMLNM